MIKCFLGTLFLLFPLVTFASASPLPGYVIHFDAINSMKEAIFLLDVAERAGAKAVNIVPPAHIWERPDAVRIMDRLMTETEQRGIRVLIARVDAAYLPNRKGERDSYLYHYILTRPGRLPDGTATRAYFRATVGAPRYEAWMRDEIRYYARRYGASPNLLGFTVGPFSEPFASERGSLLEFSFQTGRYEVAQYTSWGQRAWQAWLKQRFGSLASINEAYATRFARMTAVPIPTSEHDPAFGQANRAYVDWIRCLNDWILTNYNECRDLWHREGARAPFILQFNGAEAEKMRQGHAAFKAFDLAGWIAAADAVGLSIYTDTGFADHGHASVREMVRLLQVTRSPNKPIFVMEGGAKAGHPVLDKKELAFYAHVGLPLKPETYIYEWLKDEMGKPGGTDAGALVSGQDKLRPSVVSFFSRLMNRLGGRTPVATVTHQTAVTFPLTPFEDFAGAGTAG